MRLDTTGDPRIARARSGGGPALFIFGLPFFLAGIAVILATVGAFGQLKGNPPPPAFGIPFGGIFALVGAALMFGRSGVVIDLRAGVVRTWWGLLAPFSSKEHPLDGFDRVSLTREVRRSKNSTYTVFPVRLEGEGKPRVDVGTDGDITRAYSLAEELAKFVRLPLHDSSSGNLNVRDPDHLDESLRDRVRRTGEQVELPPPPDRLVSIITPRGQSVRVELPAHGFSIPVLLRMAMGVIMPGFVVGIFIFPMLKDDMPFKMKLVFGGFVTFFFVLLPMSIMLLGGLAAARKRYTVTASPAELRVEEYGLLRGRTTTIPATELEDLAPALPAGNAPAVSVFSGSRMLRARSDKAQVVFGGPVSAAEFRYIHALLKSVLTV